MFGFVFGVVLFRAWCCYDADVVAVPVVALCWCWWCVVFVRVACLGFGL